MSISQKINFSRERNNITKNIIGKQGSESIDNLSFHLTDDGYRSNLANHDGCSS
jgi:hypothetical protein